jgi:hypothetical protein
MPLTHTHALTHLLTHTHSPSSIWLCCPGGPLSYALPQSHVTTNGQSTSLSWNKAPIWGLRPDFYYCQTIACLLMSGTLSDERIGLSFTMYNVQCIYILHVILRYSFTNLILPNITYHKHTHTHTPKLTPQFDSVVLENQFAMPWSVNSRQTEYST